MYPRVSNVIVATRAIAGATPTHAFDGGLDLVEVGHRLDPDEVHPAGDQRGRLLPEDIDGDLVVERAEWGDDLAARPDVAGDERRAARGVDLRAGEDRGGPVQLVDALAQAVEPEAQTVATERVGHDDLRPGGEIAALDAPDHLGLGEVPDLRRIAELQPVGEEHGPHRAVGHDRGAVGQQVAELLARLAALDRSSCLRVGKRVEIDGLERGGAPGVLGHG